MASLCPPPEPGKGDLPGNTRCQRRFRPPRSFWTPLLTLPGKNNPAEEAKQARGSSAFHPQESKAAPPQSTGSSWGRCSCAGSRGELSRAISLSGLPHQAPSPEPLSRRALPLGCSQPEPGDSSEERPWHHSAIPGEELTRTHHGLGTLHRWQMAALLGNHFLTHLLPKTHKGQCLALAGP